MIELSFTPLPNLNVDENLKWVFKLKGEELSHFRVSVKNAVFHYMSSGLYQSSALLPSPDDILVSSVPFSWNGHYNVSTLSYSRIDAFRHELALVTQISVIAWNSDIMKNLRREVSRSLGKQMTYDRSIIFVLPASHDLATVIVQAVSGLEGA